MAIFKFSVVAQDALANSILIIILSRKISTLMQRVLPDNTGARPSPHAVVPRIIENCILIWLNSSLNESDLHYQNLITQLRQIINSINVFSDLDQCVAFVHQRGAEKLFIIVSDTFGPLLLPEIQRATQVHSIYVLCDSKSNDVAWTRKWSKIKGIFTDINLLCSSLQRQTQQCDHDLTSISIVSSINATKMALINSISHFCIHKY